MYAWRVAWSGTIEPDDVQTVLWTAPPTATRAATATARKTRAANERDDRPRADVQRRPVQQDLRHVASTNPKSRMSGHLRRSPMQIAEHQNGRGADTRTDTV